VVLLGLKIFSTRSNERGAWKWKTEYVLYSLN